MLRVKLNDFIDVFKDNTPLVIYLEDQFGKLDLYYKGYYQKSKRFDNDLYLIDICTQLDGLHLVVGF